jgi:hypothetical protein
MGSKTMKSKGFQRLKKSKTIMLKIGLNLIPNTKYEKTMKYARQRFQQNLF